MQCRERLRKSNVSIEAIQIFYWNEHRECAYYEERPSRRNPFQWENSFAMSSSKCVRLGIALIVAGMAAAQTTTTSAPGSRACGSIGMVGGTDRLQWLGGWLLQSQFQSSS